MANKPQLPQFKGIGALHDASFAQFLRGPAAACFYFTVPMALMAQLKDQCHGH
jgi:hypothetical protein